MLVEPEERLIGAIAKTRQRRQPLVRAIVAKLDQPSNSWLHGMPMGKGMPSGVDGTSASRRQRAAYALTVLRPAVTTLANGVLPQRCSSRSHTRRQPSKNCSRCCAVERGGEGALAPDTKVSPTLLHQARRWPAQHLVRRLCRDPRRHAARARARAAQMARAIRDPVQHGTDPRPCASAD